MKDETLISHTGLSSRAFNCLKRLGLATVGEARRTPDRALLRGRCLGKKTLQEIRQTLGEFVEPPAHTGLRAALGPDVLLSSRLRSLAAELTKIADLVQSRQQGGAR